MLTASFVVMATTQALACSCVPTRPDHKAVKDTEVVFSGSVVGFAAGEPVNTWTFEIDTVYKGHVSDRRLEVTSHEQPTACGLSFKMERRYAVFAYEPRPGESLQTNSCLNTRPLKAGEDLELPPLIQYPIAERDDTASLGWIFLWPYYVAALIGLVGLAVFFYVVRRRARRLGGPGIPEDPLG